MRKSLGVGLSILVGTVLGAGSAFAQSTTSSKSAIQCGNISLLALSSTTTASAWQNIMGATLKTSQQKDLTVGVSLECGLFTKTLVKSRNAEADSSTAMAAIEVRVLVDGNPALPGDVIYARRTQTLTAVFQGIIGGCLSVDPLTGAVVLDEACVQPEELELVLDTMNANHFNFVLDDVGVGEHKIDVQARINLGATAQTGVAEALATVGKGSLVVEEVRLVQGAEINL